MPAAKGLEVAAIFEITGYEDALAGERAFFLLQGRQRSSYRDADTL
jgi:hypothetical protein